MQWVCVLSLCACGESVGFILSKWLQEGTCTGCVDLWRVHV